MGGEKSEVRDLTRRHKAAANNAAAIFGRLGAIPDEATLSMLRLELLANHVFGGSLVLDEGGEYVDGPVDRLRYEVAATEALLEWARVKEEEVKETFRQAKVGGLIVPR